MPLTRRVAPALRAGARTAAIALLAIVAAAGVDATADRNTLLGDLVHGVKADLHEAAGGSGAAKPAHTNRPASNWMHDRVAAYQAAAAVRLGVSTPGKSTGRIVGGTPVGQTSPMNVFQATLVNADVANDYDAFFCGGSLFRNRYIVTAAHCTDFITSPASVAVLVGNRTLSTTGKGPRIKVTALKIHPAWDTNTMIADVAVWTLAQNVTSVRSVQLT